MGANFSVASDESLLENLQEGSHEAFTELVTRHSRRYFALAYRLVANKSDAEDIVQDAFLKLWNRPRLWNPGTRAKFTTWFYRVVINLCLDHKKKRRPLSLSEDVDPVDANPGQDALLDVHQKQAILEKFICELPERQQLALNLCFYEGLSNEQAAEIIGVKVKALQSLLMRAKTTLKDKANRFLGGGST
jgi:RNA polymerase sigma-70 factor (ECF subfamily)